MFENILLQECLDLLHGKAEILNKKESDIVWSNFKNKFPFVHWGRLDWEKLPKNILVDQPSKIIDSFKQIIGINFDQNVFILWNDVSTPVIKTDIISAIKYWDDVVAVAPDTWLLNTNIGYIVEVFHEGEIVVGVKSCENSY